MAQRLNTSEDEILTSSPGRQSMVDGSLRPKCTSCNQCRIRKAKCDQKRPKCSWCAENDHACHYRERKKPGLKAGFGSGLERRLERIEQFMTSHEKAFNALQTPESDYIPSINNIEPNSIDSTRTPLTNEVTPLSNGPLPVSASVPSLTSQNSLPPIDILYGLVEDYFTFVNSWFPLLEKNTTFRSIFGRVSIDEESTVLLHAIIVVSSRFREVNQLWTAQDRETQYSKSKNVVLSYVHQTCTIKSLQSMALLAIDLLGSRNGGGALNLVAAMARAVEQLGISRETSIKQPEYPSLSTLQANILDEPRDWIDEESRRRLFWLIYELDCDSTISTAHDFAMKDEVLCRALPCAEEDFSANRRVKTKLFNTKAQNPMLCFPLGESYAFPYILQLRCILRHIHSFLRQPLDIRSAAARDSWRSRYTELNNMLRMWRVSLPPNLSEPFNAGAGTSSNDNFLLHIMFFTTTIRLHSSAAYPPSRSEHFKPSYTAAEQCCTAVNKIVGLVKEISANRMLGSYGPILPFTIWVAARVLFVHASTIRKPVNEDIHVLIQALDECGEYWPVGQRYRAILQRVMDEYLDVSTEVGSGQDGDRPCTMSILADMRRCAFDLDLLISRHPKASSTRQYNALAQGQQSANLDYLEIFEFFNYPKPPERANVNNGQFMDRTSASMHDSASMQSVDFQFDYDADWLDVTSM